MNDRRLLIAAEFHFVKKQKKQKQKNNNKNQVDTKLCLFQLSK